MHTEKRNRVRVDYSAQAKVSSATKGKLQGMIRDIGLESVYVYVDPFLDFGEMVDIEVTLFGKSSKLSITAKGTVARIDQDGVAFRFVSPLEWWPVFTVFPLYQDSMEFVAGLDMLGKLRQSQSPVSSYEEDYKI
ncbi:PilZ domain-containing protein [Desulfogranum japonicum]|uniref:PilZ domain-containing protein n=1 Tax=Desulfogranum japonicum TaxID=231447 RepID=UPI00040076CF|nr:PilZ domain-containing protein [Desulfogranum japonicum]